MKADPNYSSILLSWTAIAAGLVMLSAGGEFLVSGAGRLAERLGMSRLLIGLTVVAFGTSMPELFVGIIAVVAGHPDILTGNAIGSNIANVGLILGLCALLVPLPVKFSSVSRELYIVVASTVTIFLAAWHGSFPRLLGLFFVGALVFYTAHSFRRSSIKQFGPGSEPPATGDTPPFATPLFLTVIGLMLLPVGSHFFINGATDIARHFGVSELVIGLTLAAVGTSLPELASCLAAIRQRQPDILVGNIIGSNLFNILMVLGFCGLLFPYPLAPSLFLRDIPVMFSFSAVLIPLLAIQNGLNRIHGLILLLSYLGYLYTLN